MIVTVVEYILEKFTVYHSIHSVIVSFQNKVTMAMGTTMFFGCIAYIVYMNVTDNKKKKSYVAINPDGTLESRERTSKWD
jgi:hypothetical protein